MPVQHDFETITEIGLKTWRWWNSCCLLLHGIHITKRTSLRQRKPLTIISILCISVVISEYRVGNLYCNICSPQNSVIGEQQLSLTGADVVALWLIFWKFIRRKHWPLNIKIGCFPSLFPVLSLTALVLGVIEHLSVPDQPVAQLPWQRGGKKKKKKNRCSTWEGCTQPLLLPLWEEEKPIHCEIIAFKNTFLPSRAIKEGMGILIHTIVAVTSTLKMLEMTRCIYCCMPQVNCFLAGKHMERPWSVEPRPVILCLFCSSL